MNTGTTTITTTAAALVAAHDDIEDASHHAHSGSSNRGDATPVVAASGRCANRSSSSDESTSSSTRHSIASSAMDEEEDYDYFKTQQEELNEILEAFYELVSDEDIKSYQQYVEEIEQQSLAGKAVQAPEKVPVDFALLDQDGEMVVLSEACKRGPVVLVFYRGKYCPHCNAVILNLQKMLPDIAARGASVIAISPMLPDGTAVFATKRNLQFPVLSDVGNTVARQFRLTFSVPTQFRPLFLKINEDIAQANGDDSWEIPLPATYIVDQDGSIVWSFIDDDPQYRAEPADILAAIPTKTAPAKTNDDCDHGRSFARNPSCVNMINQRTVKFPRWRRSRSSSPPPEESPNRDIVSSQNSLSSSDNAGSMSGSDSSSSMKRKKSVRMQLFGRRKQAPMEFLSNYVGP